MKHIFSAAFVALLALASCKGKDGKITTTEENADGSKTTTTVDVKGMQTAVDDLEKKQEELKKLTPLTIEQMNDMLPQEFEGAKRGNYQATTQMGYTFASAEYQKDDEKEIRIKLFDCAGEAGSTFYSTTYWAVMNFAQETDNEYTRTIDFLGGRAIEQYNKSGNYSTLTYVVGDRLLVTLEGTQMKPDELKQAAQKLSFKLS